MPAISRIDGIVIKIYLKGKEHEPPHIHAIHGECMGEFSIDTGEMDVGDLSNKDQARVKTFIERYRKELFNMWTTQEFKQLA